MRYIPLAVVLIIAVCGTIVWASGTSKLICPVCKKEIKQGTYTSGLYQGGEVIPVHYEHAFNRAMSDRFASLKK